MDRQNFEISLPSPWTRRYVYGTNPEVVTSGSGASAYAKEVTGRHQTPGKRDGWVKPLPYTYLKDRIDNPSDALYDFVQRPRGGVVSRTRVDGNVHSYGQASSPFQRIMNVYSPKGNSPTLRDKAIVKARLAMKDQSVNLGVAFAERNATARMVGDTATKLAKAYRNLRKGRWKDAARDLGMTNPKRPRGSSVTNQWLEYQYGWNPLLQDVYGAVDALAKRDKRHWRVTGKGSAYEEFQTSAFQGATSDILYGFGEGRGMRGCFVRIDALPQNDLLLAMNSLGITNPATIAWELVPYSFVVDWFLPIGDFLDSLDAMLGYAPFPDCSISQLERFQSKFSLLSTEWSSVAGSYSAMRSGVAKRLYVGLNRSVSNSVPLPSLPRFKDPRSLGHMANGLSLLSSAFSRR